MVLRSNVTKEEAKKCEDFAPKQYETNKDIYADRNQEDEDKAIADITQGKMVEVGVYNLIKKWNPESKITPVDFKIYPKGEKSYSPDLYLGNFKIHIKNCLYKPYTPSWSFSFSETNPKNHDGALLDNPEKNDIIIGGVLKDNGLVEIYVMCSALDVKKLNLYGPPDMPYLIKKKKVVHLRDIKEKMTKDQMWYFIYEANKEKLLKK